MSKKIFNFKEAVKDWKDKGGKKPPKSIALTSAETAARIYKERSEDDLFLNKFCELYNISQNQIQVLTPKGKELEAKTLLYKAKFLDKTESDKLNSAISSVIWNFKPDPWTERPVITNRFNCAFPEEWFSFEEDYVIPEKFISGIASDFKPFEGNKNPMSNIIRFSKNEPVSEWLMNDLDQTDEIWQNSIPIFSNKDEIIIFNNYISLYPWLVAISTCPLASFLDLIRRTSKVPKSLKFWEYPPNRSHLYKTLGFKLDHIYYESGLTLYEVPMGVIKENFRSLKNLHKSVISAIVVFKQIGEWIPFEFNQNLSKELNQLLSKESKKEEEETTEIEVVDSYNEEEDTDEPRFGITEILNISENFVNTASKKLNWAEKRLRFYANLYARTRDPNIWFSRSQHYQDLLLMGTDDRFDPKKIEEAQRLDVIEGKRYQIILRELKALKKYHDNPHNPGIWYEEDPSSDEETGFDIFGFEEEIEDSMAREPDRLTSHFPFDNG